MGKKQDNQNNGFNNLNEYLGQFGAKIKDGEKYINSSTKLTILNKFNIEKTIEPYVIKRLKSNNEYWTFDGVDSDKQKQELEKLKNLVESKGGSIKEGQRYVNNITKMVFIDENGFEFSTIPKIIFNYSWGRSSDSNYQFEQLKKIVKDNGWIIKDGQNYIDANTKMIFIKNGKEFKLTPSRVKQGIIESKDKNYHFEKLKLLVEEKKGKIKEGEVYVNCKTKMTFIDEDGFEFITTPNEIIQGRWNNGKGISEEICRQCIEFIFKKSFPSDWSVVKVNSDNKNNLQLDGYNKELNIAFEYQGEQHYYYKNIIGRNNIEKYKAFKKQKERDLFKEQFCKNKGIKLIPIKYFGKDLKEDIDYLNHVIKEILKMGKLFDKYINNLDFKNFKIKTISPKKEKLKQLKKIVESKGGKIKTGQVYKGVHKKMIFIDENNNEFSTTPSIIFRGCWSGYVSNKVRDYKYHIKEIEKVIKKYGAKIKNSKSYTTRKSNLTLINKNGIERDYPAYYIKKMNEKSPFWNEDGNERQLKTESLDKILRKNGAKIKHGQLHEHNKKPLIIINKYGLEIEMTPKNIMRISENHPFFHNDGITTDSQKNLNRLNEILSEYNGKIKDGEYYKDNITHLTIVNKLGEEIKLTPKSIKSLSNKHKLWLSK